MHREKQKTTKSEKAKENERKCACNLAEMHKIDKKIMLNIEKR